MRNYLVILSSRGLQSQRSNNWQRSGSSVGCVVVTDSHVGLEIPTAARAGLDTPNKYSLHCTAVVGLLMWNSHTLK